MVGRLPAESRLRFQPLIHERSFHKGQVIHRQDDPGRTLRLLKVGSVLTLRKGPDGRPRPVGIFGCGQVLGSPGLFGQTNMLGGQAVSSGRLCEIPRDQMPQDELLDTAFSHQLTEAWARSFECLADWAQVMRVRGVTGQVAATLLQLGRTQRSQLVRLPSHNILAALLGTTRETVARALSHLQAQHCFVRRDRWHCELVEAMLVARIAATP